MKPELKNIFAQSRGLYEDPRTQMIPELHQWTQQGIGRRASLAQAGGTFGQTAAEEAKRIARGDYLDVTQDPRFERSLNEAMGRASNRFVGSGRVGSGAYAGALGDAAAGVAAQLYNAERNRQMDVLSMAPQMIAAEYSDSAALEDAGRALDEDAMARFDWPYARLDRYANTIYGAATPGSKTKQPFDWMAMVGGLLNPLGSR
jgi:hypothetical protein